jgi:hypothetical protein
MGTAQHTLLRGFHMLPRLAAKPSLPSVPTGALSTCQCSSQGAIPVATCSAHPCMHIRRALLRGHTSVAMCAGHPAHSITERAMIDCGAVACTITRQVQTLEACMQADTAHPRRHQWTGNPASGPLGDPRRRCQDCACLSRGPRQEERFCHCHGNTGAPAGRLWVAHAKSALQQERACG